jgi:hypothetical protein
MSLSVAAGIRMDGRSPRFFRIDLVRPSNRSASRPHSVWQVRINYKASILGHDRLARAIGLGWVQAQIRGVAKKAAMLGNHVTVGHPGDNRTRRAPSRLRWHRLWEPPRPYAGESVGAQSSKVCNFAITSSTISSGNLSQKWPPRAAMSRMRG